jgi:phage tail-like protein
LTAGLDEVLAPVLATTDNLDSYLDPWLAPPDFVDWLAGWVGLVLDQGWPEQRRRCLVAEAVALFRMRGTRAGIRAHLELLTGTTVEVTDNGGVRGSQEPGAELPGTAAPEILVRVTRGAVRVQALDEVISAIKPAHVDHRVEVVARDRLQ